MILKNITAAGIAVLIVFAAGPAFAVKTVTSPYVHEGEAAIEWKGGYDLDDEDEKDGVWGMESSVSYGVTSYWETEVGLEGGGSDDEDSEVEALVFENKFQLAPKGALFVDPGVKVEYARSLQGGPDELQAKFLLGKKIGHFSNLANFALNREIGEDSENDLEYGFAYALAYEHNEDFAYGLEWYSGFGTFKKDSDDFDEQSHQLGPVAYGNLPGGLEYEAGVLFGVSEKAPDATLKAVLEYGF